MWFLVDVICIDLRVTIIMFINVERVYWELVYAAQATSEPPGSKFQVY
jgi:hypothetical protein